MLTRRIIPCLDVKDGRVVKGVRFEELRDAGDPVEQARAYGRAGADELCFLDISASLEARGTLVALVERVARELSIPFAVGGGVRTVEDAEALLRAGADKVSMNTAALADPGLLTAVARLTGSQSALLAIDAKRLPGPRPAWEVHSHGGTRPTGRDAVAWAREAVDRGAGEILLTSIDRDGTGAGFELELTRAIASAVPVPVIASGGAGGPAHFAEAFAAGASAALAASVFHFGTFSVRTISVLQRPAHRETAPGTLLLHLRHRERAEVEHAGGQGGRSSGGERLGEVRGPAGAAAGDDRHRDRGGDCPGQLQLEPRAGAVAVDRGEQDLPRAPVDRLAGPGHRVAARRPGAAVRVHLPRGDCRGHPFRVDPDQGALAPGQPGDGGEQVRIGEGRRVHRHLVRPSPQQRLRVTHRPHPATHGEGDRQLARDALHQRDQGPAGLQRRADVQEAQLVGARPPVGASL